MNKAEKLICLVLGGVLAWYLFVQSPKEAKARAEYAKAQAEAVAAQQAESQSVPAVAEAAPEEPVSPVADIAPKSPDIPRPL